jgi:hypothetical protein
MKLLLGLSILLLVACGSQTEDYQPAYPNSGNTKIPFQGLDPTLIYEISFAEDQNTFSYAELFKTRHSAYIHPNHFEVSYDYSIYSGYVFSEIGLSIKDQIVSDTLFHVFSFLGSDTLEQHPDSFFVSNYACATDSLTADSIFNLILSDNSFSLIKQQVLPDYFEQLYLTETEDTLSHRIDNCSQVDRRHRGNTPEFFVGLSPDLDDSGVFKRRCEYLWRYDHQGRGGVVLSAYFSQTGVYRMNILGDNAHDSWFKQLILDCQNPEGTDSLFIIKVDSVYFTDET